MCIVRVFECVFTRAALLFYVSLPRRNSIDVVRMDTGASCYTCATNSQLFTARSIAPGAGRIAAVAVAPHTTLLAAPANCQSSNNRFAQSPMRRVLVC